MRGEVISHYRILDRLGGGGMGVVYLAEDLRLKRQVALKFLHHESTEDSSARRRLVREAQSASALDHPNICTIFEIEETTDGRTFIAMAYYPGETLKARIQRRPLAPVEALEVGLQLAEALACAHEKGIVHRDLKPANVLITETGVLKLLDFGLAQLAGHSRLTRSGSVVGTAYYMSPEQLRSEGLDHRTDLWSLGVVLHEAMTGTLPFAGDSEAAVILSIVGSEPRDLAQQRPDVPEEVAAILRRCLAKEADDRYGSARLLAADLRSALSTIDHGLTATWNEPRPAPVARRGDSISSQGSGSPRLGRPRRWFQIVQRRRLTRHDAHRVGGLAILVGALLSAALYWGTSWGVRGEIPPVAGSESRPHTLAVLPFVNLSGDPERGYIAEGMAAVLIGQLGELPGLRVAARSEVWPYRDREAGLTARAIARELGVEAVLEGEYQEVGGRSRVHLALVEGTSGFLIWSRTVEGRRDRLLDLQGELAREVAGRLSELSSPQVARLERSLTISEAAYDLFLRARGHMEQVDRAGAAEHAEALLLEALEIDPEFAAARAEMAAVLLWQYRWDGQRPDLLGASVREAERALQQDPDLPAARIVLAEALSSAGRGEEAIRELRRLLAHHPDDDHLLSRLALVYTEAGNRRSAELSLRQATQLRPGYWWHWNELGRHLLAEGEFEAARQAFERSVELTELDTGWPYQNLAALELQRGDFAAAAAYYEKIPRPIADGGLASNIATTYYHLEELEKAEEHYLLAVRLSPNQAVFRANLGDLYRRQERVEEARASYRAAVELVQDQLERAPDNSMWRVRLTLYLAKGEACEAAMAEAKALQPGLEDLSLGLAHRLAKAYALCDEPHAALEALEQAVAAGLPAATIAADHDLRSLNANPAFQRLVQQP